MHERDDIFRLRLHRQRRGIQAIFDEAYVWNLAHLDAPPIDPDPDGLLRARAAVPDRDRSRDQEFQGNEAQEARHA